MSHQMQEQVNKRGKENTKDVYHLHVELAKDFEPLSKRNRREFVPEATKEVLRLQGKKNLDLWVEGSIYPIHPVTNSTPPFRDITSLINYVGDGYNGLYGYTKHLAGRSEWLQHERNNAMSVIQELHRRVEQSTQKLKSKQETIEELEKEVTKLRTKQTKLGLRQRERSLRDIEQLNVNGGGMKKRVKAIKSLLHPDVNAILSTSSSSAHYNLLLSKANVAAIMKDKRNDGIVACHIDNFMKNMQLQPDDVQPILDEAGISNKGYSAIFRSLKKQVKKYHLKHTLLPNPFSIVRERREVNKEVLDKLGQPFHIEATYSSASGDVTYDKYNNIFYDLIALQSYIVQLFEVTPVECDGTLKFVIKLDECEIVKGAKVERVTITLMNRALDTSITTKDTRWFSVQSENNIFLLATFKVPSESTDILHWVFHHTTIPEVISEQRNGKRLEVEGMGSYVVEWHMGGDLKTLKCMYNVSKGATSKSPCLYCTGGVQELDTKYWRRAPDRHLRDPNFKPILDIPLARVHICTMHGLCRIIEKLMFLYISFAWTTRPLSEKQKAILALERIFSDIGLHGGNVKIEQDEKRSKNGRDVPKKLSIGGVKARLFLSMPTSTTSRGRDAHGRQLKRYNKWKNLHNAVPDHADNGAARTRKANVWRTLDAVFKFLEMKTWTSKDYAKFEETLQKFHKVMVSAWTAQHITHYMHIICNHSPWFAREYGSVAIWSTQGMEKTHYQARTAYFSHTRHGGGAEKANSLEELHQWTYRRLIHRSHAKEKTKVSQIGQAVRLANKERRRLVWQSSQAATRHAEWRQQKQRVGKIWTVPAQTLEAQHT